MTGLVLESSTSSAKAMLYDTDTGRVTVRTQPFHTKYDDSALHDAPDIFAQTAALGKSVCEGKKVDVVSLVSAWHGVMLLNRDMTPATPVYHWPYTGASGLCRQLRQDGGFVRWYYRRTGCMVSAIYPAFKLILLARRGYDLHQHIAMGQGTYNHYRLTGTCATTASMVSGSGLLNIHMRDYDDETLCYIGLGRDSLPRLVRFDETLPLSAEGASALGLPAGIPVVPPGPDGGLNQLGANATAPGIMTFSVGTSGALRLPADRPAVADDHSLWCYLSPGPWLVGAATSGCCNCVDWAKQRFFSDAASYADIEQGFHGGPEGTPVFLPFLFGERCPGWDDARQASFTGVIARHDAFDLYHSVLEGTLYNLYQCYRKLCAVGGRPQHVRLSGGILNSAYWTQMAADIFGIPMECADIPHGSLVGGAMLGMRTLGDNSALFQNDIEKTVRPNPQAAPAYAEKFARYIRAYEGWQS